MRIKPTSMGLPACRCRSSARSHSNPRIMIRYSGFQNRCLAATRQKKKHLKFSAAQQHRRCIVREPVAGELVSLALLLPLQPSSQRICFLMAKSNFQIRVQTNSKAFKGPYSKRNPTGLHSKKKRKLKIKYTAQNPYGLRSTYRLTII